MCVFKTIALFCVMLGRSHHPGHYAVGTPDTLSETGSMKSRSRRLPYLPPEEPVPLPAQAKRQHDRMR